MSGSLVEENDAGEETHVSDAPPTEASAPAPGQPAAPPERIPDFLRPAIIKGASKLVVPPAAIAAYLLNNKSIREAADVHKETVGAALVDLLEAYGLLGPDGVDPRLFTVLALLAAVEGLVSDAAARPVKPYREPPKQLPAQQPQTPQVQP